MVSDTVASKILVGINISSKRIANLNIRILSIDSCASNLVNVASRLRPKARR